MSVPPSFVGVSVRCSWFATPNGRNATRSIHRRSGSISPTSIRNGHSRPKAGDTILITCPGRISAGGSIDTTRPSTHSPNVSGEVTMLQKRCGGAVLVAAGQTLTITSREVNPPLFATCGKSRPQAGDGARDEFHTPTKSFTGEPDSHGTKGERDEH